MKTTIDSAGRVVIPKAIRQEAKLVPGMTLNIQMQEGRILIEPSPAPVRLEHQGRLLVAVPIGEVAALTVETVEETRDSLRHEREANN